MKTKFDGKMLDNRLAMVHCHDDERLHTLMRIGHDGGTNSDVDTAVLSLSNNVAAVSYGGGNSWVI